jgi:hypothetical protein
MLLRLSDGRARENKWDIGSGRVLDSLLHAAADLIIIILGFDQGTASEMSFRALASDVL